MKTLKITYWTTTAIVAIMMTFSAFAYLTNPEIKQAFIHLGFPSYFRVELAVAKLLGAAALLIPISNRLKGFAYAGFTIVFISAFIAHVSSGDPASAFLAPLVFLLLLSVSYLTYQKLLNSKANNRITEKATNRRFEESVAIL